MNSEIQRLKEAQKKIEQGYWPEKSRETFWEHELSWLDLQLEIELIQGEIMTPGQILFSFYKSVFITRLDTKWEEMEESSQDQWNQVANRFLSEIYKETE